MKLPRRSPVFSALRYRLFLGQAPRLLSVLAALVATPAGAAEPGETTLNPGPLHASAAAPGARPGPSPQGETEALPVLIVSASRLPQMASTLPLSVEVIRQRELIFSPNSTLDSTLRRSAAFSLFRRSGALTANPAGQGVSLRGIGPSGASRALVLLDGVPVNDPFGGWVSWLKLPVHSLSRVEIVRGGGAAAWGGSSLGGVVHLLSAPTLSPPSPAGASAGPEPARTGGSATVTYGAYQLRSTTVHALHATPSARDAFCLEASAFATDGVPLVRHPGPLDIPADSAHQRASLSWEKRINETLTLTTRVRAWREDRGNGTPYQRNGSEELFASTVLATAPVDGPRWTFSLHGQKQDFRSTFSAVNAPRTGETPASDQYAVPAEAQGISLQSAWGEAPGRGGDATSATTLGLDARHIAGETREYFFYQGSAYTRERRAGGEQTVAGIFASHARTITPALSVSTGARADQISDSAGFRHERPLGGGAALLDARYETIHDLAFSPSGGATWHPDEGLALRVAAYTSYRTPTLNERYRPFRVGNITTRANPNLRPETLRGGELGLELAPPEANFTLRTTAFHNNLRDTVANVTLDNATRERRNLDKTRVRGLELGGTWRPTDPLTLEFDYACTDARVLAGGFSAATLNGRRLAQVPRHTLTLGTRWRPAPRLETELRGRWSSLQFEDDLNTYELAPSLRLDAGLHYALTPKTKLFLAIENLLDEQTEAGKNPAGVVTLASPRWVRAGLSFQW